MIGRQHALMFNAATAVSISKADGCNRSGQGLRELDRASLLPPALSRQISRSVQSQPQLGLPPLVILQITIAHEVLA